MYFIKIRNASYYRIGQGQYGGIFHETVGLSFVDKDNTGITIKSTYFLLPSTFQNINSY